MGRARIIVLIVAAICAVGLAWIVGSMLKHKPQAPTTVQVVQAPAKPMTRVLVAHQDLPVGHKLAAGDLTWQDWPADAVNPAFITDGQGAHAAPSTGAEAVAQEANQAATAAAAAVSGARSPMDALNGAIVRQAVLANQPITNAMLVRGGEGGYMSVVLRPGMRAVAMSVTADKAAGGFILPGDHVDVIESRPGSAGGAIAAQILLRNVRVLAIDQASQPPKTSQTLIPTTATLEVNPAGAEALARAKAQIGQGSNGGELILALRSFSDAGGASGPGGESDANQGQVRILRPGQSPELVVLQ